MKNFLLGKIKAELHQNWHISHGHPRKAIGFWQHTSQIREPGKRKERTLFVASREDDGPGLVADEALGDPGGAQLTSGGGAALVDNGVGFQHLDREGVAARPGLQLIHLREHRLPLRASCSPLLLRRHGHQKT